MNELFDAVSSVGWLVYLLTFILVFAEASGVPLPSLSFALLAAALAGQGTLNFGLVVLVTILGGTLGGPVGYALGQRRGRPLLEQIGGRVRITPERLDSTEDQFHKRGKGIVLARYFVPVLPWSAGIFAGIARMPRHTLVLYNFFSITLWALIELTIVAFFSSQIKDMLTRFSIAGLFWIATGVIGTFVLLRIFRRRRAARTAGMAAEAAGEAEAVVEVEAEKESQTEPEPRVVTATPMPPMATVPPTASTELTPTEPPQDSTVPSGATGEPTGHSPGA